jgi:hypothetical protein
MIMAIYVSDVHVSAFVWTSGLHGLRRLVQMGNKKFILCMTQGLQNAFNAWLVFLAIASTNLFSQSIFFSAILL